MNSKEKNLLDLKHSLYQTKAALFFSMGLGSAIALFFGIRQLTDDIIFPILISAICLIIFVSIAIKNFAKCNKIQKRIEIFIRLEKQKLMDRT